jgi:hypothetical protein
VQERQEMKPELIAEIKACYLECHNTETTRRRLAVSRSTVLEALKIAGITPRRIAGPDRMEVRPKRPLPRPPRRRPLPRARTPARPTAEAARTHN